MMVEYSLYKTVNAHIDLFKALSDSDDLDFRNDDVASKLKASTASTLTEIHDALICVIQANETNNTNKQNLRFDTLVLQMLVLLRKWIVGQVGVEESLGPDLSAETWESLEIESVVNQIYRELWQHYRAKPNVLPDLNTPPVWPTHRSKRTVNFADHIVPRFMQISEEFFSIFQGSSEKWMHLATDLLTQSAVELLSLPGNELAGLKDVLELCFAWGYVERSRLTQTFDRIVAPLLSSTTQYQDTEADVQHRVIEKAGQMAETEDRVWEMFYDQGSSNNPPAASAPVTNNSSDNSDKVDGAQKGTPQSSGELRAWRSLRQQALDDVLVTHTNMLGKDEEMRGQLLRRLRGQYPLKPLLAQLTLFIEEHWTLSHSQNWNGMPVLVQIEEGRLEGLSAEEFELFKQSAGITNMP